MTEKREEKPAPRDEDRVPELLPEIYQQALVESVTALQIITQLVGRSLESEDITRLVRGLSTNENDIFMDKLAELLRQRGADGQGLIGQTLGGRGEAANQAEVHHLDHVRGPPAFAQHQIRRLDVAMNKPRCVRLGQ